MSDKNLIDKELENKIQELRKNLLDISLKNRLIKFTFSDRSKKFIRIVDEVPQQIFSTILEQEKGMSFKYLPGIEEQEDEKSIEFKNAFEAEFDSSEELEFETEAEAIKREREIKNKVREKLGLPKLPEKNDINSIARLNEISPEYDLPSESNASKHSDLRIQTLYSKEDLNKRLQVIYTETTTNENDKGINTLYLAFGFLEWRESENSTTKLLSPLILLPLSIEAKTTTKGASYKIYSAGRPIVNKCLDLKLQDAFKMKLPTLNYLFDDDGNLIGTIEDFFQEFEKSIEKNIKWKLRRYVTLANLDFNKVVMYDDLDTKRWGKSFLSTSDSIRSVLWGDDKSAPNDVNAVIQYPQEYDIDSEAEKDPINDFLIKEADSSQHAAILDTMKGKHIVIAGPPGTGKSQTITNLIAQALARGKTVLFVCEKLAAMRVVKNRLDYCKIDLIDNQDASLGDFCFELHSNTSKKKIHDSMSQRLRIASYNIKPTNYSDSINEINKKRLELRNFSATVQKHIGNSGLSFIDAIWAREKLYQHFNGSGIEDCMFNCDNIQSLSAADIATIMNHIGIYAQQCKEIEKICPNILEHPWRWVKSSSIKPSDEQKILNSISNLTNLVGKICDSFENLKNILQLEENINKEQIKQAFDIIRFSAPDIDKNVFKRFKDAEYVENIKTEFAIYQDFLNVVSKFPLYTDRSEDIEAIIENNRIDSLISELHSFDSPFPDDCIKDLENEYSSISKDRQNIDKLLTLANDFPEVFSLEDNEFSLLGLIAISGLIEYLKGIDEKYYPFILSGIHSENESKAEWNEAYNKSLLLERFYKLFGVQLDIDKLSQCDDIKSYAATVEENSSIFKWLFNKDVKEAKKALNQICPLSKKYTREEKKKLLIKMSDFWTRIQEIKNSPIILKSGLEQIITQDGRCVQREYDDLIRSIWNFIMSVPNQKHTVDKIFHLSLGSFYRFIEAISTPSIVDAISSLKSNPKLNSDRNLKTLKSEILLNEKYLQSIISLGRSFYLKEFIPISDIHHICDLCEQAKDLYSNLRDIILFVRLYQDRASDVLINIFDYQSKLKNLIKSDSLRDKLFDNQSFNSFKNGVSDILLDYEKMCEMTQTELKHLESIAGGIPECINAGNLSPDGLSKDTISSLNRIKDSAEMLGELRELNVVAENLVKDNTLDIANTAIANNISYSEFESVFQLTYLNSLIDSIDTKDIKHVAEIEKLKEDFCKLDKEIYHINAQAIAKKLCNVEIDRGVSVGSTKGYTEYTLIKHEAGKMRAHIPVRQYIAKALKTIIALKPCFMMSPQTVSQYLPNALEIFDLLIIDEASQMLPSDAIAAMARSKQVVIVGDKQQLPPTNFFSSNKSSDELEDGESILDIAERQLQTRRMLNWHYRARHESLINFSNEHFYDGKLTVFPSKDGKVSEYGIKYHNVEGFYKDGINVIEAETLISTLPELIKNNKNKSIGIVAMNQKQAELIRDKIELLITDNSEVAEYIQSWEDKLENFFVKNLENVQGDERDIIIISFVYGRESANQPVKNNFGPINQANGYRRLNVLFSRAKEQIHVFTSMNQSDIKFNEDNEINSRGPLALKQYLYYAANGGTDELPDAHTEPENDFESSVGRFLSQSGYHVRYQVGSIGYFIDIVIDDNNGRHIIGIECDGAQYHSSKSARDRDKLRQQQLENLGWKIYRVWSTDWFYNRSIAEKKLLNAVKCIICP